MATKLQRWMGPRGDYIYDDEPRRSFPWTTEKLTAYTEAEEAAHIREIVSLTLKNVNPMILRRFTHAELVDRTIRAMGSAIASSGGDRG